MSVAIAAWFIFTLFAGLWHGERQYRLGFKHGRAREATDAQHARERVVAQAESIATMAYLRAPEKGSQHDHL